MMTKVAYSISTLQEARLIVVLHRIAERTEIIGPNRFHFEKKKRGESDRLNEDNFVKK